MVSKAQIEHAINEYCKSFEGHSWMLSDDRKRFVIKRPDGRDVQVWQENGKFRCSDRDIGMVLVEMAPAVADKDERKAAESTEIALPLPARQRRLRAAAAPATTSAPKATTLDISEDKALAEFHRKKARTYRTEDGEVPTAAMVNRNANRHRFCTEVLEYIVTDDLIRAKVRVTDPITGQYKEDGVAFTRNAFVAKKTIDIISKHIKKNPGLVVSVDPVTMRPELSDTAMIYDMPARLFVAKEVLKSWNFLGRFAITTAERRCQDKLLNAEWRENEEIELERAEIEDVAEAA
jgi:hypothetical protein